MRVCARVCQIRARARAWTTFRAQGLSTALDSLSVSPFNLPIGFEGGRKDRGKGGRGFEVTQQSSGKFTRIGIYIHISPYQNTEAQSETDS